MHSLGQEGGGRLLHDGRHWRGEREREREREGEGERACLKPVQDPM